MPDLKPKSFRINDETADKFKQISAEIGGNQQETLSKLIEAYEFQAGKVSLIEKKADIELFEKYVNALTRMYMGSLEDNQNITGTVRTEYDGLLTAKDKTIQDLQKQLEDATRLKEDSVKSAERYLEQNSHLSNEITNIRAQMADKENLNQALTASYNELKEKFDAMEKEHDLDSNNIKTIQEQEAVKWTDTMQHEIERAVFDVERKYQNEIQNLKEQHQEEIDRYQKKYLELFDKIGGL